MDLLSGKNRGSRKSWRCHIGYRPRACLPRAGRQRELFPSIATCLVPVAVALIVALGVGAPLSMPDSSQSLIIGSSGDEGTMGCGFVTVAMLGAMNEAEGSQVCEGSMLMPIPSAAVISTFDAPSSPWMSGHRGIDMAAAEGQTIVSPDDGTIGFSGRVAGKDVVTVVHGNTAAHGNLVSSFEPARSDLNVGNRVTRGQAIGTVSRGSDHCDDRCLHWGLRTKDGDGYVDPLLWTASGDIVLKPVM